MIGTKEIIRNTVKDVLTFAKDGDGTFKVRLPYCKKLPNVEIDIDDILKKASEYKLIKKANVIGVILFGSAARMERYTIKKNSFFGLRKKEVVAEGYKVEPNDIDIFLLCKEDVTKDRLRLDLRTVEFYPDHGYGNWEDVMIKENGMDIVAGSVAQLWAAIAANDSVALSIVRDGILLAGESKIPLNNQNKVHWEWYLDAPRSAIIKII